MAVPPAVGMSQMSVAGSGSGGTPGVCFHPLGRGRVEGVGGCRGTGGGFFFFLGPRRRKKGGAPPPCWRWGLREWRGVTSALPHRLHEPLHRRVDPVLHRPRPPQRRPAVLVQVRPAL